MPDTADHRAAMYELAESRKRRGWPVWILTLNVKDVFDDDEMGLEEKRDIIVSRIRASRWPLLHSVEEGDYSLDELLDELSGVDDEPYFDQVWSALYDLADYDRVWIATI